MNISLAKRATYYRVGDSFSATFKRGRALKVDGHKFNDAYELGSDLARWYIRAVADPDTRIIVRRSDYDELQRFGIWDELEPAQSNVVLPTRTPDRLKAVIDQIFDLLGTTFEISTTRGPGTRQTYVFGTPKP